MESQPINPYRAVIDEIDSKIVKPLVAQYFEMFKKHMADDSCTCTLRDGNVEICNTCLTAFAKGEVK